MLFFVCLLRLLPFQRPYRKCSGSFTSAQQSVLLSDYFKRTLSFIHCWISCHMVSLVLRQPLFAEREGLGTFNSSTSPGNLRERESERKRGNFVCKRFLPELSCSLPFQQKQQAAAKRSVNGSIHAVGKREGGREGAVRI